MSKVLLKDKGNTSVYYNRNSNEKLAVYHNTTIVRYNYETDTITLNSGGWYTYTTKQRMNQFMDETRIPLRVFQKNYEWYVYNHESDETIPFTDNQEIKVVRTGGVT